MADARLFFLSTILFALAAIITIGASSPIEWLSAAFEPWLILAYVFIALGVLIFSWNLFGNLIVALILSVLITLVYYVARTGVFFA